MSKGIWALILATAAALTAAPTRILDTMTAAGGGPANGTCVITWPSFRGADGVSVSAGTKRLRVRSGVIDVALPATAGGTPTSAPWLAPAYAVACYLSGGSAAVTEYWQVPASSSPVTLATVRQGAPGQPSGGGSNGDVLGPNASVGGEAVVFGGSTGKSIARASGSGVARLQNGVLGTVPGNDTDCVRVNGTSGTCGAGNVTGPGSSTVNNIPKFANGAGTQLADSGVSVNNGTVVAPGGVSSGDGVAPGFLELLKGTPSGVPATPNYYWLFVGTDGVWRTKDSTGTVSPIAAGAGDVAGPSASVDSEIALYSGTTGKALKRSAGSGVLRLQNGVASTVPGSASDCVRVDASSGPCGASGGTASWFVPFYSYSPVYGGFSSVNLTAGAFNARVGVDATGPLAYVYFPESVTTGAVFMTSIPGDWNGTSALTVRLLRLDSTTTSRRLIARVRCALASLPVDGATAITWGASATADIDGATTWGEATVTTSLSLSGCTAGAPVLVGIFRDGVAITGGGSVAALGVRLSVAVQ